MRRPLLVATVVALAVLAGCAGLEGTIDHPLGQDPDGDPIGWENGYWYDESVDVTTDDGLNASEREAVLSRTMARVERIRQLEFRGNVSLEVIGRDEYRNRSAGPASPEGNLWNEQVWEALLLVGEERQVESAFGSTLNSSVQGFYSPANDSIVIVSDSATPTIDRATLSHELVHALQDQHGSLGGSPETQDRQLARQSVTEGEANYVQALYERRCDGRWQCLDRPASGGTSGGQATDGVFLVIYQPYATGPQFVHRIREAGDWDAVDALYRNPPNSTEQVIHPDSYPDETPVDVTVPDRSNDRWSRFDHDPVADTVGEASVYAMLTVHDAADVPRDERYSYESEPSAGWAGDAVVPYRNGSDGYGYVWRTAWDSTADAREFAGAYRSILDERAATRPSENVYVLPESDPYGDAFRVVRDGDRVTVVNAPTRADLSQVHSRPDG